MLNRQFCAATSTAPSAIGRFERVALAQVDERGLEPGILQLRFAQVRVARREHLVHHVEPDHAAGPSREVRELQHLHAASHSDVEDRRRTGKIARVDRAAAAIIHGEHLLRERQLGKLPDRCGGAAQTPLWIEGGFLVDVTRDRETEVSMFAPPSRERPAAARALAGGAAVAVVARRRSDCRRGRGRSSSRTCTRGLPASAAAGRASG